MSTYTAVLFCVALVQLTTSACLAGTSDTIEVSGTVLDPKSLGIPGAIVSPVSPDSRQKSAYSDDTGRFTFHVPIGDSSKWYLEIYWNKDLMYRNELRRLRIAGVESNPSQSWVDAFNNGGHVDLEPIVIAPSSTGQSPLLSQSSITAFIQDHMRTVEDRKLNRYVSAYNDQVNWYTDGYRSADYIRDRMKAYFAKWDTINYQMTGPAKIYEIVNTEGVRVRYPIRVSVTNSSTGAHNDYVGTEFLEVRITNGALRIFSENEVF